MSITELLSHLRRLEVSLWAEGDRLRYRAPKGALDPELRAELKSRKGEILDFLRSAADEAGAPPLAAVARDQPLPPSFSQQRLWFVTQLEPGNASYNLPAAVAVSGPLDAAVLIRSLAALVDRHEALRTALADVGGQPRQVIAPVGRVALPVVDLGRLPAVEREAAAQRLAEAEARRLFDLGRAPLVRTLLVRRTERDHLLVVTMHHAVSDGWSMGVFIHELGFLYEAFAAGRPSPLPPLPIQFADFAHWQRRWLQGEVLEALRSWWRRQLGGLPTVLELPTDRPRPPRQTFRGTTRSFRLPAALVAALRSLGQERETTLFMTLLAAFQTLLYRYTGQERMLVGSPIAGRQLPQVAGVIGFFVNTLVLRGDLGGDPPFDELLARVRETAVGAYAHQEMPFETLVDELRPPRDLSRTPLFQVMLAVQEAPPPGREIAGLRLRPVELFNGTAKFDLLLAMADGEEELSGQLEYNLDLFDHATMARWRRHFVNLLAGVVAEPGRRLSALPLLATCERRQLVAEWNDTAAGPADHRCLHELIAEQAARTPEAVAVVCESQARSYGALEAEADRLAHRLRRLGVGPETVVALYVERSPEMVVAMLGILKAGGAYLPLDPNYPAERLSFLLSDAEVRVLVTREELEGRLGAVLPEPAPATIALGRFGNVPVPVPVPVPDSGCRK